MRPVIAGSFRVNVVLNSEDDTKRVPIIFFWNMNSFNPIIALNYTRRIPIYNIYIPREI